MQRIRKLISSRVLEAKARFRLSARPAPGSGSCCDSARRPHPPLHVALSSDWTFSDGYHSPDLMLRIDRGLFKRNKAFPRTPAAVLQQFHSQTWATDLFPACNPGGLKRRIALAVGMSPVTSQSRTFPRTKLGFYSAKTKRKGMAIRRQPALSPAARKKEPHIHALFQKQCRKAPCSHSAPSLCWGVTHVVSETRGDSVRDLLSAPL